METPVSFLRAKLLVKSSTPPNKEKLRYVSSIWINIIKKTSEIICLFCLKHISITVSSIPKNNINVYFSSAYFVFWLRAFTVLVAALASRLI